MCVDGRVRGYCFVCVFMFCVFRETCVGGVIVFYTCGFCVRFGEYMNAKVTLLNSQQCNNSLRSEYLIVPHLIHVLLPVTLP